VLHVFQEEKKSAEVRRRIQTIKYGDDEKDKWIICSISDAGCKSNHTLTASLK